VRFVEAVTSVTRPSNPSAAAPQYNEYEKLPYIQICVVVTFCGQASLKCLTGHWSLATGH